MFFYDSLLSESLVEWVNDNMDVKIHVWYWNIVTNTIQPDKLMMKYVASGVFLV